MKIREIMAILANMDPDSNVQVAAVIDDQVIVDTIDNVKPSFAGPLIQTTGFRILLQERAKEAGIKAEPVRKPLTLVN